MDATSPYAPTRGAGTDLPSLDTGVRFAANEVADLLARLEPDLTNRQLSLLHQLRLASESLGALRALALLEQAPPAQGLRGSSAREDNKLVRSAPTSMSLGVPGSPALAHQEHSDGPRGA
jgi:hypothetical protein